MENINFKVIIIKNDDIFERKSLNLDGNDFLYALGENLNTEKSENDLAVRLAEIAIDKLGKMYKEKAGKDILNIWYVRYKNREISCEIET